MYEVILGTCGIQQIGWATLQCPFTSEEGVGDAPDSYAWDGKRVQRWNVSPHPYGTPWAPGDVIGVCADMESGQLSFVKNGADMGGDRRSTPVFGVDLSASPSRFLAAYASLPPFDQLLNT
jgi:Kip1 ubiquitination-promoting complex protein 1